MKMDKEEIATLRAQIRAVEARLAELQGRMPAHSMPPALLAELDELDEQLAELTMQLAAREKEPNKDL